MLYTFFKSNLSQNRKPSTSSAVDKGDHSEIKNTNSTHRTNDYQSDEVTSTVKDDQPDIFNNSDGQPLEKELNATKITKSLQSSSAYCQEQLIKVIKEVSLKLSLYSIC